MLTRQNREDLGLPSLPETNDDAGHQTIANEHIQQNLQMATAAPEVWKTNPYTGDFNPANASGRKIFEQKSKGLDEDKRFDLSKVNSTDIQQYFKAHEEHLGENA